MTLAFNGVFVGPSQMPGFWKFMYRVSPMTYLVDGLLSVGIANNKAECSTYEFRDIIPPKNMSCGEYLDPYLKAAGTGYLLDSGNAEVCKLCSISSTNAFLSSVSSKYSRRWRNFGLFLAYIVFDYACTILVYWLARVPKKSSRVKEQGHEVVVEPESNVETKE